MPEARTMATGWRTITSNVADPSNNGFTPVTDWFDCAGLEYGRCEHEVRNLTGELELIPAIQLADHPRDASPSTSNLGSTWTTANGIVEASTLTDVQTAVQGSQVVRLGFVTRNDETTALSTCEVRGRWDLVMKRRLPDVVLDWDFVLAQGTTWVFFPVTDWEDFLPMRRMTAVGEIVGRTGNLQAHAALQIATDTDNPDAAISFGPTMSTDGVYFPSFWTASTNTPGRRVRLGFNVRLSTGSTRAQASMRARILRLAE